MLCYKNPKKVKFH